jgi:hypothetical protein
MKIIGRNPNPDRYSIKEIRIDYELHRRVREKADGTRTPLADVYLLVDLEPKPYMRQRFVDGHSYGPKKNPCTLRIKTCSR